MTTDGMNDLDDALHVDAGEHAARVAADKAGVATLEHNGVQLEPYCWRVTWTHPTFGSYVGVMDAPTKDDAEREAQRTREAGMQDVDVRPHWSGSAFVFGADTAPPFTGELRPDVIANGERTIQWGTGEPDPMLRDLTLDGTLHRLGRLCFTLGDAPEDVFAAEGDDGPPLLACDVREAFDALSAVRDRRRIAAMQGFAEAVRTTGAATTTTAEAVMAAAPHLRALERQREAAARLWRPRLAHGWAWGLLVAVALTFFVHTPVLAALAAFLALVQVGLWARCAYPWRSMFAAGLFALLTVATMVADYAGRP